MKPILDKVYVYKPSKSVMEGAFKTLNKRTQEMSFINKQLKEVATVHRYAKTLTIGKDSRTLLMITKDDNKANVNKAFSEFKKKIEADETLQATFIKAEAKPLELGLMHEY